MQNRFVCSALFLGLALVSAPSARAQALITAGRPTAVTPFATMTLVSPDWGPTRNPGYTFGVDYTHFIHSSFVQPSFELRATAANGTTVNEHTYLAGLNLQTSIHRIYPYATFLAGYGLIHYDYYNGGYTGDHSIIYSLGGGADIPVLPYTRLRLDFTRQSWNIDPQTINPITLSAGIAFTLPGRGSR